VILTVKVNYQAEMELSVEDGLRRRSKDCLWERVCRRVVAVIMLYRSLKLRKRAQNLDHMGQALHPPN
jgi:hypothetical protein